MAIVAVQPDHQLLTSGRYQSFSVRWLERLPILGHQARAVDLFRPDLIEQLAGCDGLMWWFAHLPFPRNFAKRLMTALELGRDLQVFPNVRTCWHFDDKIAQWYLLEAAGLPAARTWIFWRRDDASAFCREAQFPLVLKLAGGITSENVRLLRSRDEAEYWIGRLFGAGVTELSRPSLRRPRSVLRSLVGRARAAAGGAPPGARRSDVQRGYVMVQEFIAQNDYDTRAVVIGRRAYAFRRFNRPNDFRASGSGLRDTDPTKVDLDMVRLAFTVAERLGTQSIAVDGLYRSGQRVLTEISYYYEGWVLYEECPGYWQLEGSPERGTLTWVGEPLRPEDAILSDFIEALR